MAKIRRVKSHTRRVKTKTGTTQTRRVKSHVRKT
jgi:hypothetical protein